MPTVSVETAHSYAVRAFEAIFRVAGRPMGSTTSPIYGVSDNVDGIQWNIYVFKDSGAAWLGVNLEGMKYDGWPIATFIQRELRASKLLPFASTLHGAANIWVAFTRDAWQAQSRPPIKEQLISGSEVRLSELTAIRWRQTLTETYACLNPAKDHRGRVKQSVTLTKDGTVKPMWVSPHLNIHTRVWALPPASENVAKSLIHAGYELLKPVHELVTSQSQ